MKLKQTQPTTWRCEKKARSYADQLRRWVKGESLHVFSERSGRECCPDFSCCIPKLLQPREVREEFRDASPRRRDAMCMEFLGLMLVSKGHTVAVCRHGAIVTPRSRPEGS